MKDPLYFSVGARWITWIIALAIVLFQAAPPVNLRHAEILLALTGLQLLALTRYPRWNPLLDIGLGALVIWASGGWRSPFYEFSLTALLAPSLRYGLRGATLASLYYTAIFVAAVALSEPGMASVYNPDGRLDGGFVGALLNPFMISYFSAFLAELLRRLEEEKSKVRALERHKLGREIHDGVAQTMFMLTLSLDACREVAHRRGDEEITARLDQLVPVARQALWEVRNAMLDQGALLEGDLPFGEALRRLVKEFESASGMRVELTFEGDEPALPAAHRVGMYRTIQEAMANAFKHSQAAGLRVQVRYAGEVTVVVEDTGVGFDRATARQGHGLGNMESRVEEMGGTLRLESRPGEGTRVQLVLPGR